MMALYATPLSANGRKVLAVAHHLGLSFDAKTVNVYRGEGRSPEYLDINPSGRIPTLTDGEFVLFESNAILQYLAEEHGGFELSSRSARERAQISSWMFWESSSWQPALTTLLAGVVGTKLGLTPAMPSVSANWGDTTFRRVTALLDAHLRGREFLVGDRLTIADFSVAGMLTYARCAAFPFDQFSEVGAWYERIERTDAWQATATSPWT